MYSEEELPAEFKLYLPVQQSKPSSHGLHHSQPQPMGGGGSGGGGDAARSAGAAGDQDHDDHVRIAI